MLTLKAKFEGGFLDRGAQPMLGWLRTLPNCSYCQLHTYTWCHITSGQPEANDCLAVSATVTGQPSTVRCSSL